MTGPSEALLAAVAKLKQEAPPDDASVKDIVWRVIAVRKQIAALKSALHVLEAEDDELTERTLPDKMIEAGLVDGTGHGSFDHESGASIYLTIKTKASVVAASRLEVFAWLRANGHGALIQDSIPYQTLNAWVKSRQEEGEPIPPGISTLQVTKANLKGLKGVEE
jgi:hypothetical protein